MTLSCLHEAQVGTW